MKLQKDLMVENLLDIYLSVYLSLYRDICLSKLTFLITVGSFFFTFVFIKISLNVVEGSCNWFPQKNKQAKLV